MKTLQTTLGFASAALLGCAVLTFIMTLWGIAGDFALLASIAFLAYAIVRVGRSA